MTTRILLAMLLALPVTLLVACEPGDQPAAQRPASLPVVQLADIENLIAETAAENRALVIDFWATWCIPCVAMFPGLHEGVKAMDPATVRMVSITLDGPGEDEQQAIEFLAKHHALKDAYLLSPDADDQIAVVRSIGPSWNHLVVPAIFVFDRQGELAGEFLGGPEDLPAILATAAEAAAGN